MAEVLDTTSYQWPRWGWKKTDAVDDKPIVSEEDVVNPVTIDVLGNDNNALGVYKIFPVKQISDVSLTDVSLTDSALTDSVAAAEDYTTSLSTKPYTITLESGAEVELLQDGTIKYDSNGKFEHLDDGETATDSFGYAAYGRYNTDWARVDVTIKGVDEPNGENHPPVANNDYASLPDYYPYPGPIPLPYEESADSTTATTTDASLSDAPIMTTLAIGEEGDPYPYPSEAYIDVLANDTDADGDPLHVATIAGTKVDTDPTTDLPDSVTLGSGAKVALNADGSLTYSEGIIVYADTDPQPLTEEAVTLAGGELVPIDPILPPEPVPYPWPWLVDQFTYTAADNGGTAIDDEGLESNVATVTVYHAFYDYILAAEPVTDASAPVASEPSTDIATTEPFTDVGDPGLLTV